MDEDRVTADGGPLGGEGVALWRRIAGELRAEIGGALPPGSRLPTEAQLAARFGVNRHTVRRAVDELSRAGLLRVEQGRGSFVAEDVIDYTVAPRTRFSEWIRRQNREPSGRVLALREEAADAAVAAGLMLRDGAPVVVFERLGLADDRPVGLTRHHFPAERLPGLAAALADAPSITEALRRVGVADYLRVSTRVTARMPLPAEASLLRVPRTQPVLLCEHTNADRDGRVVEFAVARLPTPRVQVVFEPREQEP